MPGWSGEHGDLAGAFLRGPRHPALLTPMPDHAVDELVGVLPAAGGIGCDVTTVDAALAAWERHGTTLVPRHRLIVHRLDRLRPPPPAPGRAGTADAPDATLLHGWFDELMAQHPGDPSDRSYVVDDPLAEGRIVIWEDDTGPVAMAGRSRTVAGMTRVGATYVPAGDPRFEAAVLAAATAAATVAASDVLVPSPTADRESSARLAARGYRAVRERILLVPAT